MSSFLSFVDKKILNVLCRLALRVEESSRQSENCFTLARGAEKIGFVILLVSLLISVAETKSISVGLAILIVIAGHHAVFSRRFYRFLVEHEGMAESRQHPLEQLANSMRRGDFPSNPQTESLQTVRLGWLTFTLISLAGGLALKNCFLLFAAVPYGATITLHWYWRSCTPLPPEEKKPEDLWLT